jgi:hypothetical protein
MKLLTIWTYDPMSNTVLEQPHDPRLAGYPGPAVAAVAPADLLKPGGSPGQTAARIAGRSILNGREAIEIEIIRKMPPEPAALPATAAAGCDRIAIPISSRPDEWTQTAVTRFWINRQTTILDESGAVLRQAGWQATVIDLKDASDVPPDVFRFQPPPGAQVRREPAPPPDAC